MAEASARDRLYPSLLDRLVDDDPGCAIEPRENRSTTLLRLRDNLLRDLNWLFNATQPDGDLCVDELLAGTVLNYGLPALAGRPASHYDLAAVARMLREVIVRFEPRILARSLTVRAERGGIGTETGTAAGAGAGADSRNVLAFRIEGQLWSQPMPLEIFMRTEIDLESGLTQVVESKNA